MNLNNVIEYFESNPKQYLNVPQTISYILHELCQGSSYATKLLATIEDHERFTLSDTVFYRAIKVLMDEEIVTWHDEKSGVRGRPRKMFEIADRTNKEVEEVSRLWNKIQ